MYYSATSSYLAKWDLKTALKMLITSVFIIFLAELIRCQTVTYATIKHSTKSQASQPSFTLSNLSNNNFHFSQTIQSSTLSPNLPSVLSTPMVSDLASTKLLLRKPRFTVAPLTTEYSFQMITPNHVQYPPFSVADKSNRPPANLLDHVGTDGITNNPQEFSNMMYASTHSSFDSSNGRTKSPFIYDEVSSVTIQPNNHQPQQAALTMAPGSGHVGVRRPPSLSLYTSPSSVSTGYSNEPTTKPVINLMPDSSSRILSRTPQPQARDRSQAAEKISSSQTTAASRQPRQLSLGFGDPLTSSLGGPFSTFGGFTNPLTSGGYGLPSLGGLGGYGGLGGLGGYGGLGSSYGSGFGNTPVIILNVSSVSSGTNSYGSSSVNPYGTSSGNTGGSILVAGTFNPISATAVGGAGGYGSTSNNYGANLLSSLLGSSLLSSGGLGLGGLGLGGGGYGLPISSPYGLGAGIGLPPPFPPIPVPFGGYGGYNGVGFSGGLGYGTGGPFTGGYGSLANGYGNSGGYGGGGGYGSNGNSYGGGGSYSNNGGSYNNNGGSYGNNGGSYGNNEGSYGSNGGSYGNNGGSGSYGNNGGSYNNNGGSYGNNGGSGSYGNNGGSYNNNGGSYGNNGGSGSYNNNGGSYGNSNGGGYNNNNNNGNYNSGGNGYSDGGNSVYGANSNPNNNAGSYGNSNNNNGYGSSGSGYNNNGNSGSAGNYGNVGSGSNYKSGPNYNNNAGTSYSGSSNSGYGSNANNYNSPANVYAQSNYGGSGLQSGAAPYAANLGQFGTVPSGAGIPYPTQVQSAFGGSPLLTNPASLANRYSVMPFGVSAIFRRDGQNKIGRTRDAFGAPFSNLTADETVQQQQQPQSNNYGLDMTESPTVLRHPQSVLDNNGLPAAEPPLTSFGSKHSFSFGQVTVRSDLSAQNFPSTTPSIPVAKIARGDIHSDVINVSVEKLKLDSEPFGPYNSSTTSPLTFSNKLRSMIRVRRTVVALTEPVSKSKVTIPRPLRPSNTVTSLMQTTPAELKQRFETGGKHAYEKFAVHKVFRRAVTIAPSKRRLKTGTVLALTKQLLPSKTHAKLITEMHSRALPTPVQRPFRSQTNSVGTKSSDNVYNKRVSSSKRPRQPQTNPPEKSVLALSSFSSKTIDRSKTRSDKYPHMTKKQAFTMPFLDDVTLIARSASGAQPLRYELPF